MTSSATWDKICCFFGFPQIKISVGEMNEPDKFYDKELPYFDIQLNKQYIILRFCTVSNKKV